MANTGIDPAAIWIMAADDHVVEAHQRGQHCHRRDQPKRTVAGYRESQAHHVGFARAPIPVKNRGRARPIHVPRSFCGARNYHKAESMCAKTRLAPNGAKVQGSLMPVNTTGPKGGPSK